MRKAVAKEGPRAPLFCLGAALLITASGFAAAQAVEQSDLELCAALATTELKLACFEALAASDGREAPSAADAAQEPLPESAATEKALVTAGAAASMVGSDVADEIVAENPGREDPDEEHADLADDPVRETPDEIQADVFDELGREDLDEDNDQNENSDVRANVSEVVKGNHDVLYFHFTNGQVWRQIEPRRFRYPREVEFEVIISKGMMGDYRLRLDENSPMTPIRRVR